MCSIKSKKFFLLIDCNNFYVSCERIFNPLLEKRPIVILSNNDGCIVARSEEAKKINIPMGAPYFKYKKVIEYNNGLAMSSNYQLYGDISQRVMNSLKILLPGDIEIYSIDEMFVSVDVKNIDTLLKLLTLVKEKIYKWVGIPVSIGVASTKTLAKLANRYAKKNTKSGIFYIENYILQKDIFINTSVEDIWGISTRWGRKLKALGYNNAYQLCHADTSIIRSFFGVVLLKIVQELIGNSCIDIEQTKPKKNIMSSKSFGKLISEKELIEEALSSYVARSCEKLRAQKSMAQGISVFLNTNRFKLDQPQYNNSITIGFDIPSSDTGFIINQAKKILSKIFKNNYKYNKTGVILLDIIPDNQIQYNLFFDISKNNNAELMRVIDSINNKYGRNTIFYLAQGVKDSNKEWQMKSSNRSPRYTTNWEEILKIY